MPPRPELAGTVQIDVEMSGPLNVKAHNILHAYAQGATYLNGDLQALANTVKAAYATGGYHNHLASGWALVSATVTDLAGDSGEAVSAGAPVVGTVTGGNTLPPNCAICVSWKAGLRYRGGHFRSYLPGFTEADLTVAGGSALSTAVVTDLTAWGGSLISAINGQAIGSSSGHWEMVGITRVRTAGDPPVRTVLNPPTATAILQAVVDGRLDSQRRRLGKGSE